MKERKKYGAPATKLVRVELESDICAGSQGQDFGQHDDRHVNIKPQDNGGSVDFTTTENSWD